MSQLIKTKRQANFKDFKLFGAFRGLVKQKNVIFNSFVCKLGFLARVGLHKNSSNKLLFLKSFLKPTRKTLFNIRALLLFKYSACFAYSSISNDSL
jgi:hypothetical protein